MAVVNSIQIEEIRAAQERLKGIILRTPLLQLDISPAAKGVLIKPEVLQPTAAFKIRGVYNWAASLTPEERKNPTRLKLSKVLELKQDRLLLRK